MQQLGRAHRLGQGDEVKRLSIGALVVFVAGTAWSYDPSYDYDAYNQTQQDRLKRIEQRQEELDWRQREFDRDIATQRQLDQVHRTEGRDQAETERHIREYDESTKEINRQLRPVVPVR